MQRPAQRDVTVFEGYPGRVEAVDTFDVRARVRGFLKEVHFEDGQEVEEGELLLTIKPDMYRAALDAVQAAEAEDRM